MRLALSKQPNVSQCLVSSGVGLVHENVILDVPRHIIPVQSVRRERGYIIQDGLVEEELSGLRWVSGMGGVEGGSTHVDNFPGEDLVVLYGGVDMCFDL